MGIAVFILIGLIAAGIIVYPLIESRKGSQVPIESTAVRDEDIQHAVDEVRRTRAQGGLACPACGTGYQAGDLFCVACGHDLPDGSKSPTDRTCPSCGAQIRDGDQFCPKCGHRLAAGEAA